MTTPACLPDEEVDALASLMDRRAYAAGAPVFDFASPRVHVVVAGEARLYYRHGGREITVDVLHRGGSFGISTVFDRQVDGLLAEAATDLIVAQADGETFLALVADRPWLGRHLVSQLAARVLQAERWLADQGSTDAYERLAGVLEDLAERAGSPDAAGGWRIEAPLRHEDLAHYTGASRETITRMLARLERDGRIRRQGRRIVVFPATAA